MADDTVDVEKILSNVAENDMRRVRKDKNGAMFITDTKNGLLELAYNNGMYRLTTQGYYGGQVLAEGAARFVKPVLMQQYVVVYED